jgi:ribosomal protein L33
MKNYCTDCKKITPHVPKLTALLEGKLVCAICRTSNYNDQSYEKLPRKGTSWLCRMDDED